MLINDLLKNLTPDTLVYMIKSNPLIVQSMLYKFESYKTFAETLTNHQQTAISSNLYKLGEFFKSTNGKESLNTFVNHFISFATKK
jgi:hypothetical protein